MSYLVNTPCGQVLGVKSKNEGVVAFKGVRYATARRFEYPTQVTHWEGIYDASKYGSCCYQPRSFYNEEEVKEKVFYYNEFRKGEVYSYSEDCLFLNIFVKESVKEGDNLPVIVYIHGGGFKGGCGHEKHFDEPVWPLKDVIAVTINYRLGPLGFMCLEELKDEEGRIGNFGLYDQYTALKWIKDNISSFGGNPNNITIMGQSAGAMSVQQLCMSPLTEGLFHKAVMSSGGGVNKILATPKPDKYYEVAKKTKGFTNSKTIEELKNVPVEELFKAWDKARKETKGVMMPASPVVDGKFIIDTGDNILKNNKHRHIPYILGANSEDMMAPFMYNMAKKWCDAQDIPSYAYLFNHQLPGDDNGAWHSSDLWYFFGTHRNSWRPMNEIDDALSEAMVTYLTNFAKEGNPNGGNLPNWKDSNKKQKEVMHLGNGIISMNKTKKAKLWYNLFTKKAVGE